MICQILKFVESVVGGYCHEPFTIHLPSLLNQLATSLLPVPNFGKVAALNLS